MVTEFIYATLANNGSGVTAAIAPAGRQGVPVVVGTGDTIERAIGAATRRPGLRFHTNGDELQAEIATFRQRGVSLMIRDNELITLGFR